VCLGCIGYGLENSKQLVVNDSRGKHLLTIVFLCYFVVLSDPAKRLDYDLTGSCEIEKYSLQVLK
jgi:hypothetical protein